MFAAGLDDGNRCQVIATTGLCISDFIAGEQLEWRSATFDPRNFFAGAKFPDAFCEATAYTVYMHSVTLPAQPVPVSGFPMLLPQPLGRVQAGFPSPAEDFGASRLDLTAKLIKHPQATFVMGVSGLSMKDAGIDDGDLIVIDRAVKPVNGHIVLAVVDGEFTVKYLALRAGHVRLKAANPTFPDIIPRDGQTIEVWGVVTSCVKLFVR